MHRRRQKPRRKEIRNRMHSVSIAFYVNVAGATVVKQADL
jgi:hypothetical protein